MAQITIADLERIKQLKERDMMRVFFAVIDDVRDNLLLSEFVRLFEMGRIDLVLEALQLDEATWQPFADEIIAAYKEGAATGVAQVGRIEAGELLIIPRFNLRSPRAEQWLARESSKKIVQIAEEQKQVIREKLEYQMSVGKNPKTSALEIMGRIDKVTGKRVGGVIGLTMEQQSWVDSAERELRSLDSHYFTRRLRDRRLDSQIRKYIDAGKPIPQGLIDTAITRMQARAERYRGEVIARTESLNALRAGQHEAIMQAAEKAELDEDKTTKTWSASGGERTRETHRQADGQKVALSQPFRVGRSLLMYPGDSSLGAEKKETIQCRCRSEYIVDFTSGSRKMAGF